MKKYFYSDGKEKHGPLSLDELKQEDISKHTLIWFEGLDDWTPAGELDELKPILELQPPPILNEEKIESGEPVEKTVEATEKNESKSRPTRKGMFSSPFSFDGRIRRLEYGISTIIFVLVSRLVGFTIQEMIKSGSLDYLTAKNLLNLSFIPLFWFICAQGAKRCHDLGKSGWWQIIPFYGFWLLFQNGQQGLNEYGRNPKS